MSCLNQLGSVVPSEDTLNYPDCDNFDIQLVVKMEEITDTNKTRSYRIQENLIVDIVEDTELGVYIAYLYDRACRYKMGIHGDRTKDVTYDDFIKTVKEICEVPSLIAYYYSLMAIVESTEEEE